MKILRPLLNLCLLAAFLSSLITGVIKFPELSRFFGFVYNYISASQLAFVHDWSGIILALLILIHILFINRRRLFRLPEGIDNKIIARAILALVLLLAFFYSLVVYKNYLTPNNAPVKLSGVEVREYQGEKLDSVNSFRENSIKGPQYIDEKNYTLSVAGLVDKEKQYTYNDILALPKYRKVVELDCVEGWNVKILWEGTLVRDIIKAAGIKPEANTIIFYAVDGYSTSFPLDFILHNNIIMADKMNGIVLPPECGFPFELVAEQKWGYKWIKWITKIELSADTNYQGYWESRGYNNNGDLNRSKYE